jgi:hypothetical protein
MNTHEWIVLAGAVLVGCAWLYAYTRWIWPWLEPHLERFGERHPYLLMAGAIVLVAAWYWSLKP